MQQQKVLDSLWPELPNIFQILLGVFAFKIKLKYITLLPKYCFVLPISKPKMIFSAILSIYLGRKKKKILLFFHESFGFITQN